MRKLFAFIIIPLILSACVRTHRGDPYVPSIEGSWLVTELIITATGDDADEAEAIMRDIFDGWDGFTLIFNPDNTVVIPEGTELYSLTDYDLWIITMSMAHVEFTVNTLTDIEMELTCNALTGIGEPVSFPSGTTSLQLYLHAERQ